MSERREKEKSLSRSREDLSRSRSRNRDGTRDRMSRSKSRESRTRLTRSRSRSPERRRRPRTRSRSRERDVLMGRMRERRFAEDWDRRTKDFLSDIGVASKVAAVPPITRVRDDEPGLPGRIFVGRLSPLVTVSDLRDRFGKYGPLLDVTRVSSKGFAFLQFGSEEHARAARKGEDRSVMLGCVIGVKPALGSSKAGTSALVCNPYVINAPQSVVYNPYMMVQPGLYPTQGMMYPPPGYPIAAPPEHTATTNRHNSSSSSETSLSPSPPPDVNRDRRRRKREDNEKEHFQEVLRREKEETEELRREVESERRKVMELQREEEQEEEAIRKEEEEVKKQVHWSDIWPEFYPIACYFLKKLRRQQQQKPQQSTTNLITIDENLKVEAIQMVLTLQRSKINTDRLRTLFQIDSRKQSFKAALTPAVASVFYVDGPRDTSLQKFVDLVTDFASRHYKIETLPSVDDPSFFIGDINDKEFLPQTSSSFSVDPFEDGIPLMLPQRKAANTAFVVNNVEYYSPPIETGASKMSPSEEAAEYFSRMRKEEISRNKSVESSSSVFRSSSPEPGQSIRSAPTLDESRRSLEASIKSNFKSEKSMSDFKGRLFSLSIFKQFLVQSLEPVRSIHCGDLERLHQCCDQVCNILALSGFGQSRLRELFTLSEENLRKELVKKLVLVDEMMLPPGMSREMLEVEVVKYCRVNMGRR